MSFLDELSKTTNRTLTENSDVTNKSTLDPALDFFAVGGALRNRKEEFVRLFRLAYAEEPLTALRTLFYFRDVRGGQGERELFRAGLNALSRLNQSTYDYNLHMVPEFGRWDDIFAAGVTSSALELVHDQMVDDLMMARSGKSISLLAKWLPSENASSKEIRNLARRVMAGLDMSPEEYRRKVVTLRRHIHLLEQDMSENKWDSIDYAKLPSQAHRKHVKAFNRHSPERYAEYLGDVLSNKTTINANTFFTYELYNQAMSGRAADREAANVMWQNLPDYTQGTNALVVADVSGSMWGLPLSVSVSLALYFAERNTGPFKDYFMTFSESPALVKIRGNTLAERMSNISKADWSMNTDLRKAFDAILRAAKAADARAEDIPRVIYIISDMEFDGSVRANESTFEYGKRTFAEAGFTLPHVVFWNVNARNTIAPATKFDMGVTLVSGLSQSAFSFAMEGKTPRQLLDDVVSRDRYEKLVVVSSI